MQITTEMIKELRDQTGVSVMQCKKALEEAGGDMETALMVLKKKSSEIALKKSDREASQGAFKVLQDETRAVLVELNCETDFVAKNEDFTTLLSRLAQEYFDKGEDALRALSETLIPEVVQKIGENIRLGRFQEIKGSVIGSYVHDGRIGVIAAISSGTKELAKDIAMHIAAMNPEYVTKSDIPEEMQAKAKELFIKEVEESDKPQDIKEKMLQGKIDAYFRDLTLMDQGFFKDQNKSVGTVLKENSATLETFTRVTLQ